jgi:hypothetical protein
VKIPIFSGVVNAAADLETVVTLTEAQKAALSSAILFGGGAVLRVKTGAKTESPTATLASIMVSFDTTGDFWRVAQALSIAVLETASTEYEGPELYAKVLACRPARIKLNWTDEDLDGDNYFADCLLEILVEDRN